MTLLDKAVLRVLEAKFRMGLFEHPFALTGNELEKAVHHPEDDEIALQSAREALVLLKNDGVLPLSGNERTIAVIGPQAANPRYYFGGYTHLSMVEAKYAAMNSMAGVGAGGDTKATAMDRIPGSNVQDDEREQFNNVLQQLNPECKSLLQILKGTMPECNVLYSKGYNKAGNDNTHFSEAMEIASKADVIILTLGGKYGTGSIATMGEGIDATDINLPKCQDDFIREVKKLGKPLIGVHFDGRPISSDAADECLNAILECWTPGAFAAEAVGDVLLGKENPSGKLPLSVARNAGQIPVYYNHPNGSMWHQAPSIGFADYSDCSHKPRYCFGHGLSYTSFAYTNLNIDKKETAPFSLITVSFSLKNEGTMAGTEIVQMYVRDVHASMTRPVKELQGFARVQLKPGEQKTVQFILNPSQMAFLDEDMRWKIEKGEFEVQIGSSSDDIRLISSFNVADEGFIEGRNREFCSIGKIFEF